MQVPNYKSQKQKTGKKPSRTVNVRKGKLGDHTHKISQYATPEFGLKTNTRITRTTKGKRITLLHYNTHPQTGASQRNWTPKHESPTKRQDKKRNKKKQQNRSTACVFKPRKRHKKHREKVKQQENLSSRQKHRKNKR